MTAIAPTANCAIGSGDGSVLGITWTSILHANLTGAAIQFPEWADVCVQAIANTAGSATLVIEGSNDGTNYGTLYDAQGNALSFTATGAPKQIVERPRYIRPRHSGGDNSEDWTVIILARRGNPLRT